MEMEQADEQEQEQVAVEPNAEELARQLTTAPLSGEWLDNIAKALRIACCTGRFCSYLGAYSAVDLPEAERFCAFPHRDYNCHAMKCFIANTDPVPARGEHWVAFVVFAKNPRTVAYFDSFGRPLSQMVDLYNGCVAKGYFTTRTCSIVSANAQVLQGNNSTVCGHYCLLFIYLCARMSRQSNALLYGTRDALGSAMRYLVTFCGGDRAARHVRDKAVFRMIRTLLLQRSTLTPVFECTLHKRKNVQCCKPLTKQRKQPPQKRKAAAAAAAAAPTPAEVIKID